MARVVMTTLGSYGDINPFLAIGRELKRRGHTPVLATGDIYVKDAAREGIEFAAVPPNGDPNDSALMARVMGQFRGSEVVVRELIVPIIRDAYAALERASDGADVLLSHPLTFAGPILAEKRALPWLSVALQPILFFSAYDPPVVAPAPWLAKLRRLGPGFNGRLLRLMKRVSHSWTEPVRALRRELGLPADVDPLFEGGVSPHGVLAMFSRAFAEPQPDWPARVRVCGFPFFDEDFGGSTGLSPALTAFLDAGPAPVVFTLGSSAVQTAGDFYTQAAAAAARLGQRAVLLAGAGAEALRDLPPGTIAARSAPYHELFPRASAVVHSGGIGTTAQALRSGRPQIVVPFAHDQFDNGSRVERLGAGTWLRRGQRRAHRLARALERLLSDAHIAAQAARAAQVVRAESGVASACDAIEALSARS